MQAKSVNFELNRRGFLQMGGAVIAASALSSCSFGTSTTPSGPSGGAPRTGGELLIGVSGGGPSDSLDAHTPVGEPDISRVYGLYDTLSEYRADGSVGMLMAESITPENGGRSWVIRLKDGLTFHNGKAVEAADVIATLMRITDPKAPKSLASAFGSLDRAGMKQVDRLTVRVPLTQPSVVFAELLADYKAGIVPVGYDPRNPVGSGPFMADTFVPGQRSSFKKFANFRKEGRPYVDRLTIINFADDASRVNALQSGQVQAITSLPFAQVSTFKKDSNFVVVEAETDNWRPFAMHCGVAPFNDVRVRQALRLCVDREQMVAQVLNGHGRAGNDVWSPNDPASPKLEARKQDLDQARSLLKSAGHEGLQLELNTAPVIQGMVEFSTVFAEQARGVVDIKVNKIPAANYYGDKYLHYPFSMDYKGNRSFLRTVQQSGLMESPFNPAHFDDPEYLRIVKEALTTIDDKKRGEMIGDAQRMLHERGGYIVPVFTNMVDAHSTSIGGLKGGKRAGIGLALDDFGFEEMYFTA